MWEESDNGGYSVVIRFLPHPTSHLRSEHTQYILNWSGISGMKDLNQVS
jgi:hypothetical protein